MSEELLVNLTPQETRVALVENGVLQEVYIERSRRRGLVGNIYKGRVVRVLPGMEAAFIDIGLDRAAFLHVSDIQPEMSGCRQIDELLQSGQSLVVQVVKDAIGSKGARLTTNITIASCYLVLLANSQSMGISVKIDDETERQRLKEIVNSFRAEFGGGYIVRTAAEGTDSWALRADMQFLQRLWSSIQQRAEETAPGELIYEDLPLALRTLRDFVGEPLDRIRVDSRSACERLVDFAERFVPQLLDRIEHYPGERPIFDLYSIEDEIQRAISKRVSLKSGGYLVIDQTEAMTTIDVNTGAFVGHRNLEETIYKTNLEAAQAIARQLRLRNLGGIIIIDFIDMTSDEHKQQMLRAFERALQKDRARTQISGLSALGLVEMTRKRTRESLEHVLCQPCPTCQGRGSVKSAETVCFEIFREVLREARQYQTSQFLVLASQEVIDLMLDEESDSVAELESFTGVTLKLQAEVLYTPEQFDVVMLI